MSYYLLLVAALALAALGLLVRKRFRAPGQVMVILGILGCAGCVAWQVQATMFPQGSAGPDRGQAVVSYYLANQVLSEVGNQKGPVVVFFPPDSVIDEDTVGTYAGTFARVLRSFPALQVQVRTLDVPGKAAKKGQIPLAAFQQAASQTPGAVAYVSYAGVPPDIEKFSSDAKAGFFVFDPWGTTNWLSALKAGRVRGIIVPRPGIRADSEAAGEPQEVFKRFYLMGTPATATQVAAQLQQK